MIILKDITLTNFMCIESAYLDFSNNLTIISGENGSGKSSVLDAVSVCISDGALKRSAKMSDYIRHGEKESTIILNCFLGEEPLLFDVIIKESVVDKKITYKGKTYVKSECSKLLEELDLIYYSNIFFSIQENADITKLSPATRASYLQKLFNISFQKEAETIIESLNKTKEESTEFSLKKSTLEDNIKNMESKILVLKDVEDLPSEEINKLDSLKIELDSLNETLSIVSGLKSKLYESSNKSNSIEINLNNILNQLSNINKYRELKDSSTSKLTTLKKELEETNLEFSNLGGIFDLTKNIEKLDGEIGSIKIEIGLQNQKKTDNNYKLDLIKKGKCPTCENEFDSKDLEKYYSISKEISSNIEELEKKETKLYEEKNIVQSELNSLLKKETELKSNINNLNYSISKEEENVSNYDSFIKKERELMKEKLVIEKTFKEFNENVSTIKNDLILEENKLNNYDSIKKEYEVIQAKILLNKDAIEKKKIQDNLNKEYEGLVSSNKKEIENINSDIVSISNRVELLKNSKTIFEKTLPNFLTIKMCFEIEKEMNQVITSIFPTLKIKLSQSKSGVDFYYSLDDVKNKEDDIIFMPIKMASGFQKAVISASFRIALCKMYGLKLTILDEVDAAGTENFSSKFFDAISSSGIFEQMIIITHKPYVIETLRSISDKVTTYKVEKGEFEIC